MNLEKFAEQLKELYGEIQRRTEVLENSAAKGFKEMSSLLEKLEMLLPDLLFFVQQTGIGNQEYVLGMLSDMEKAMQTEDMVLMGDALLNGLGGTVEAYIKVIEEALHEE